MDTALLNEAQQAYDKFVAAKNSADRHDQSLTCAGLLGKVLTVLRTKPVHDAPAPPTQDSNSFVPQYPPPIRQRVFNWTMSTCKLCNKKADDGTWIRRIKGLGWWHDNNGSDCWARRNQ